MIAWVTEASRDKADAAHHRLPQFYLRGFAGASGRLDLLDPTSARTRSRALKNTFAETGYYTFADAEGQRLALAEVAYEDIENHAARVHRLLLSGAPPAALDVMQRSYYAFLLAVQITRGEHFRAFDAELAERMGRSALRLKAAHAERWWERFYAEQEAAGEPVEITRERFVEFVERGEFSLSHSRAMTVSLSLSAVRDLAEIFFRFSWHVLHFPEPCLFTAEEPIAYWVAPERPFPERGIGPLTADEVRFPLSPRAALILTHPRFAYPDRKGSAGLRLAAWLNYWTWIAHPAATLVLNPDIAHPLPNTELLPSVLGDRFAAGPIIDR